MKRTSAALGILGLVWAAALPASAQKTIKLFGNTYSVVAQNRTQTFKNAVTITTCTDEINRFAGVSFSEGADRATDRLWFGCRLSADDNTGDGIYYLEGTDASGSFTPAASTAKSFFGGNADYLHTRRPISILELNRDDTLGKKKDRNVIATTFQNNDCTRMWDLDSMTGLADEDQVFIRVLPKGATDDETGVLEPDPHGPIAGYMAYAHLPKPDGHTVVVGGCDSVSEGATGLNLWDTRKDDMFDVLTNITEQTKSAAKTLPTADADGTFYWSSAIARYGDQGEYLILYVSPEAAGGNDAPHVSHVLARVKLELPADPSKAKPGDIKATVLDVEELTKVGADSLFQPEKCGPVSVAAGRPVTAGGPPVLYITDYAGFLYTLTPQ